MQVNYSLEEFFYFKNTHFSFILAGSEIVEDNLA